MTGDLLLQMTPGGEGKDEVVRKRGCSSGWQMNFSITNPEKNQL